jgi:integrase
MTASIKIGPLRLQPFFRNGKLTEQWQIDIPARFMSTGRRQRILASSKRAAQEKAHLKLREIQVRGMVAGYGLPTSIFSLRDVVTQWLSHEETRIRAGHKKISSLEVDGNRLAHVLGFMGDEDIARLSDRRLLDYQAHRRGLGRRASTINGEMRSLRVVLGWARKQRLIAEVPHAEPLHEIRKQPVILTQQEAAQIVNAIRPQVRILVRFLLETGCRIGEAVNLTWSDVDEVNGVVSIQVKDGWTPKTAHSERKLPIAPGLLSALRKLPKSGPYVFTGRKKGRPISSFRAALVTAVKKAQIIRDGRLVKLSPHMLRKAYATWQAERGIAAAVLQPMLGHAPGSRVTAQYYVYVSERAMREAVLELPAGERNESTDAPKMAKLGNKA